MGNKLVEWLSALTTSSLEITSDILILQFRIVNAFMIGNPKKNSEWFLVDTGLENSANYIIKTAIERFGVNSKPKAIILTHGHFDHIGSLIKLNKHWNVPIYIHKLEIPYITGQKDYPVGDPKTDEGMVSKISPTFPHTSINIEKNVKLLPEDGQIPNIQEWKWIWTPGHSPGHISIFREKDHTLIVGDAFCTVKQESLLSVVTQHKQISGPPKYFTIHWKQAFESIKSLEKLKPKLILPSHGKPLKEKEIAKYIGDLINHFNEIAVPDKEK